MVEKWSIRRPMLVDDLEGTVHRAYGALPNMAYVIDRGGRIAYKADWTHAPTLALACEQLLEERRARREGRRLAPCGIQWQPLRVNEREPFMEGLAEIGPRAVDEFIAAIDNVHGPAASRVLDRWRERWARRGDEGP